MRIAFIGPVGVIGGAERVLLAAIRGVREHLPAARIDVVLFADGPLRSEAGRLEATETLVRLPDRLAGIGDTQLRGRGRARSLARLGWVALGGARPRGVPVLWHLHDFPSHRPVMARLMRRMCVGAAGGIAISDAVMMDEKTFAPDLLISPTPLLDTGDWPQSRASSGEPGGVADGEVDSHLASPGNDIRPRSCSRSRRFAPLLVIHLEGR